MNQREKKTTATKTNRTGIASLMRLVGELPALISKKKNRTLTENEAYNQAINTDCILAESDASEIVSNPFASSSNITTPRHTQDSALHSSRQ